MIVTTTPSVDGKTIGQYLGIVVSKKSINEALNEIQTDAGELGADAVVGLQIAGLNSHHYDTIYVYGTAVKFK